MQNPEPARTERAASFTPRAQSLLVFARKEAERLDSHYVETAHLMLAMVRQGEGTAVAMLNKQGLPLETLRAEMEKVLQAAGPIHRGPNQEIPSSIPYDPRVHKVLALAAREARALNSDYVGTEHILLGLLQEGDGLPVRALKNLGLDAKNLRKRILKQLRCS